MPDILTLDEHEKQFSTLLNQARDIPEGQTRNAVLERAYEFAKQDHYSAEPHPALPDPLADMHRDCVLHLRMCELLELGELFNPIDLLSGFTRRIEKKMRSIYATGVIRLQPPLLPSVIPNGCTGTSGWLIEPAREAVRSMLDWCASARSERASTAPISQGSDSVVTVSPPSAPDAGFGVSGPTTESGRRYALGELIGFLDGIERNREFQRLNQQEQLRRDPVNAALNAVYSAALRWQPDEDEMPGIRRIELLCDLESGDAGINAAKVRRLRARICQQQSWQTPHADVLTLDEAADLLEGVRQVSLDEMKQASKDHLHHGLANLDMIGVGAGKQVEVTGLSCKVIAGTVPTACPDAKPALPPSMLPLAEQAIRRLYPLPANSTIHWVGHDTGYRSRCRCHPNAPFAAPFDRNRWATVAASAASEPSEPSAAGTAAPSPTDNPTSPMQTPPTQLSATTSPPFTVRDIRDLLVYRVKLAAFRANVGTLDPVKVLAASCFPSARPLEAAKIACALTPPEPPQLTDDEAWTLPTYRRIAETARSAGRDAPDESDLMKLVGTLVEGTTRTIEDVLRMPEPEFERLVDSRSASLSAAMMRIADASRCPECGTPPKPLDLAAGGTAPCRQCGLWGLATGRSLLPLADEPSAPIASQLHAPYWVRTASRTTGQIASPADTAVTVCLRDHAGREHSVSLAACHYNGRPVCPDYLAQTPDRLGAPWLVERLLARRDLELWMTRDGIWFVLDRERAEAVALNGAQLHDLQACPAVTTTTTPRPTTVSSDLTPESEASRKTGRPLDPIKQEVVKYVGELREQKMPWKNIPDAVFKKFGVRYTSETLRGYLKSG